MEKHTKISTGIFDSQVLKGILSLLFIIIIVSCGCIGSQPMKGKENRLLIIGQEGELKSDFIIDSGYMNTATSVIEDKNGNLVIGGAGVDETFAGSRPEIIRIDEKGGIVDKKFYESRDDRWITTLSNDTKGNIFAVCYSGKALILDEGGMPVHVISVNATGPGWWVSLDMPEGFAAASMNEAFSVSENGSLLWHTVFPENETSVVRPLFFVNDGGNYVISSYNTSRNEDDALPVELDKNGNIIRENFPQDIDANRYRHNYCETGGCYAETGRIDNFWFLKDDYFVRLVAIDSEGGIVLDKRYKTGDFYNDICRMTETSDGGYAVIVEAWN